MRKQNRLKKNKKLQPKVRNNFVKEPSTCAKLRPGSQIADLPSVGESGYYMALYEQLQSSLLQEPHMITKHKGTIQKYLAEINESSRQRLIMTLEKCLPVEFLLNEEAKEFILSTKNSESRSFWQNIIGGSDAKISEKHSIFEPIASVIIILSNCRKAINHKSIKETIEKLIDYYKSCRKSICVADYEGRRCALLGQPMFITEYGEIFFAPNVFVDCLERSRIEETSNSNQAEVNYEELNFKINPISHGTTIAGNELSQLVIGKLAKPQLLCLFYNMGSQMALSVSQKTSPQESEISTIDECQFAQDVILSILSNPRDGNVDSHMIWSPALILHDNNHWLGVRNDLYNSSKMYEPLDDSVRKKLVGRAPTLLLLEWFKNLWLKQKSYNGLFEILAFPEELKRQIEIPFLLKPGTITEIYRRLQILIECCGSRDPITPADLLNAIDRPLWQCYQEYQSYCHSTGYQSAYNAISSMPIEGLLPYTTPEMALIMIEYLSAYVDTPDAYISGRSLPLESALQELLGTISFQELPPENQNALIQTLFMFDGLTELTITSCDVLTDTVLEQLVGYATQLSRLTLKGCSKVTEEGLRRAGAVNGELRVSITQNEYVGQNGWPKVASFFKGGFDIIFSDGYELAFSESTQTLQRQEALINAVMAGSEHGVKFLLQNGTDANWAGSDGFTPLHYAAQKVNLEILTQLLNVQNIKINAEHPDTLVTPLQLATCEGHSDNVSLLLKYKANPAQLNCRGQSAIHIAARWCSLELFAELLSVHQEHDMLNKQCDDGGQLLLHYAAANPNVAILAECLQKKLIHYNVQDHIGNTPLHVAVMEGLLENVKLLLSIGDINIGISNKAGMTAYLLAQQLQLNDIVNYFKTYSAKCMEYQKVEPQDIPVIDNTDQRLLDAIKQEDFKEAELLILEAKQKGSALVYVTDRKGNSPLHYVSEGPDRHKEHFDKFEEEGDTEKRQELERNYLNLMKLLLDGGAKVETKNNFGETPLRLAVRVSRSILLIEALLKHGANLFDIDEEKQRTLLHEVTSIRKNQLILLQFLVENGASSLLECADVDGMYPFYNVLDKTSYPDQMEVFSYIFHIITIKQKGLSQDLMTVFNDQKTAYMETVLHLAVGHGHYAMVEHFLKYKPALEARDLNGNTALHKAVKTYMSVLTQHVQLENSGQLVSKELSENCRNAEYTMTLLLTAGANVLCKNYAGETPLMLIQSVSHLHRMFAKYQAVNQQDDTDSFQKMILCFFDSDVEFAELYQHIMENPHEHFKQELYTELFERYQYIYRCVAFEDCPPIEISFHQLLKDIKLAQKEAHQYFVRVKLHSQPKSAHELFFKQISQRACDYNLVCSRLNELRLCHQQMRRVTPITQLQYTMANKNPFGFHYEPSMTQEDISDYGNVYSELERLRIENQQLRGEAGKLMDDFVTQNEMLEKSNLKNKKERKKLRSQRAELKSQIANSKTTQHEELKAKLDAMELRQELLCSEYELKKQKRETLEQFKKHPNLILYYRTLQIKLEEIFISFKSVAGGWVDPTKGSLAAANAVLDFFGDAVSLAPLIGSALEKLTKWGVQKGIEAVDEKRQKNTAITASGLVTLSEVKKHAESVARQLTESYTEQLLKLATPEDIKERESMLKKGAKKAKKKIFKSEELYPAKQFAAFAVVWLFEKLQSSHQLSDEIPLDQCLVNVIFKKKTPKAVKKFWNVVNTKLHIKGLLVKDKEGYTYWHPHEVYTKPGIKADDKCYASKSSDPDVYGWRLGTLEQVEALRFSPYDPTKTQSSNDNKKRTDKISSGGKQGMFTPAKKAEITPKSEKQHMTPTRH